ncbi:MAG: choice-of-anchor Q domain-containing protein [Polyangia bacterium]
MPSSHLLAMFAVGSMVLPACGGAAPRSADAGAIGGSGGQSSTGGGDNQISSAASGGNSGGITGSAGGASNRGGTSASTGPAPIAGLSLFFSDLTSGPNSGGQSGKGAYVTVFGNGFGDTQGTSTVTIGGSAADNYLIWTNTKITFQLGGSAKTGDIVVHVPGKGDSNALPFTVRASAIYFVTASGSDSNDGSFANPWKTIPKAKNSLSAGDIAYLGTSAGDTLAQTVEDSSSPYGCALGMSSNDGANSGTANAPKALVAYPGASVTIGVVSGLERGILTPAIAGTFDYWVISQLSIRGETEAIDLEGGAVGWRIVGNDISCPNGSGESGCVTGGQGDNTAGLKLFGNVVHDAAANVATITKYYHGIYFGSDSIELGWNTVRDGKTCRAIQFHDSAGPNEFDLVVHDNVIHGTVCDGLNFASVDPSQGAVVAYNNVIYDVGQGPDPADGSSDYTCIYVANITNQGSPGSGNVQLYNNTLYNCGSRGTGSSGAIALASGPVGVQMDDNLIVALTNESYFSSDTGNAPTISGSNNLLYGAGTPPSFLSASVSGDPMFVDPTSYDFHLTSSSPAVDHGKTTSATTDIDGNPRPQGSAFDIGAYELVQ